MLKYSRLLVSILVFFVALSGITVKVLYGYSVVKKHMPNISFFEYYWGLAR